MLSHLLMSDFCDPVDCNLPGSSVHGIFRQESWSGLLCPPSWPRDQTRVSCVSCTGRWIPYWQRTWEAHLWWRWDYSKEVTLGRGASQESKKQAEEIQWETDPVPGLWGGLGRERVSPLAVVSLPSSVPISAFWEEMHQGLADGLPLPLPPVCFQWKGNTDRRLEGEEAEDSDWGFELPGCLPARLWVGSRRCYATWGHSPCLMALA